MNVAQYTFQSPSTSPVQVGKLDPGSVKEEAVSSKEESKVEEPKQLDTSGRILDIYA